MNADQCLGSFGRVARRSPFAYATSWPLEEVELVRPDGTTLLVLVKRLVGAERGKPAFLHDPAREIEAYGLLAGADLGTPCCYASGRWWIALEKVDGLPLWQRGDLESWEAAAAWAARLHERFGGARVAVRHLLRHDERFYRRWFARARAKVGDELDPLRPATEAAIARLLALPSTLIHGELYASNVLIEAARVAAVDWEMAALGPGVIDVAALVTGWDGEAQRRILAAFGDVDEADLAAAKLTLALQWLGWTDGWQAPAEHRRDWLSEARAAAEALT